ncbi:hypothetical protein [Metabacillus litoralis]|uniref:hypothetical protein n=1 Tax=Metabacillus litoralis TaxID=152268 RepID=UPI0013156C52|nr:hypothetical protein [Metabacillus litoralis]
MNDLLFLIVSLLLLSFITGMKMLIHIWSNKYEYKNAWDLVDVEANKGRNRRQYRR